MNGDDTTVGPLFPPMFDVVWVGTLVLIGVGFLLVVAGIVAVVVLLVRNVRRARAAGVDPFTAGTDLTARLLRADVLAPARSTSEKLAELDRLHAAGTITTDEHAAARARVLGS